MPETSDSITVPQRPGLTAAVCIIHLIRNTFRVTSKRDLDAIKRGIRPIYTAVNATAATAALDELEADWGQRYPAVIRLWRNAWAEFIPFVDYDIEIRQVICTTNAIESLNASYRRAVKARSHFPTEQAALKCLYLPGPDRDRTHPVGDAMEARHQRLRHHLRRPVPGRRDLLAMTAGNTVPGIHLYHPGRKLVQATVSPKPANISNWSVSEEQVEPFAYAGVLFAEFHVGETA